MPDGSTLALPIRDMGSFAMAGFIANQASFVVLDQLAEWLALAAADVAPEVIVGLPTLGHTVGAAIARALGQQNWVAPCPTRKRWYDDEASAALASITSPATGANFGRRMWLDPRLLYRLQGRRVALVDDVTRWRHAENLPPRGAGRSPARRHAQRRLTARPTRDWMPLVLTFKAVVGASLACNPGPHVTDLGTADGTTGEVFASALIAVS